MEAKEDSWLEDALEHVEYSWLPKSSKPSSPSDWTASNSRLRARVLGFRLPLGLPRCPREPLEPLDPRANLGRLRPRGVGVNPTTSTG